MKPSGAVLVAMGCVGSGVGVPVPQADPGAVPATVGEIQEMVFTPSCEPGCHSGGAAPKGLSLEDGWALDQLVGVASVEVPELARVVPGASADSYLVVKIASSDSRRVGLRMPRTGPPYLSDAQISAIRRWIDAGAQESWVDGMDTGEDTGKDTGKDTGEDP